MLKIHVIERKLQSALSLKRYIHTMGVVETAIKMAALYGGDREKIHVAALLHDCAKDYPDDLKRRLCKEFHVQTDEIMLNAIDLMHAPIGAEVARREYQVTDEEILNAIACHTTGKKAMTLTDKIVFVADYIEPNRKDFAGITEARQEALKNIDKAVALILGQMIQYIKEQKKPLHPLSVEAYEYYSTLL